MVITAKGRLEEKVTRKKTIIISLHSAQRVTNINIYYSNNLLKLEYSLSVQTHRAKYNGK